MLPRMKYLAASLLVALAGCSSSNSGGGGGGGGGGGNGDMAGGGGYVFDLSTNADLTGTSFYQASIGPITLSPGQERTVCSTFRLGNTDAMDIIQIDATLMPGSHHLIFYESNATSEAKAITDCQPLDLSNGKPIYIAETQINNRLSFPSGVAYHLAANQMIRLEAHYLNASPNTLQGMGTVNLLGGVPGTYQAADIMFCGTTYSLSVPPGMSMTSPAFWKVPAGIKLFGVTTHEHKRGTLMTVDKSSSTAAGTNLIMGQPYDNPPLVLFDDAHLVSFNSGEGLRWQCFYDNPDSTTYHFGESGQSNEMCFYWAYYFPSVGHFISGSDIGCWQ